MSRARIPPFRYGTFSGLGSLPRGIFYISGLNSSDIIQVILNTLIFYVQFLILIPHCSKKCMYNLNAKDNDGKTALMVAKQSGFQDIVMFIKAKLT